MRIYLIPSWLLACPVLTFLVNSYEVCNYHPVNDCPEYIARGSNVACSCRAEVYNPGCGGGGARHYSILWQELGTVNLHLTNAQDSDDGRTFHCVYHENNPPDGALGSFNGQPITMTSPYVVHIADPHGPSGAEATGPATVTADGSTSVTLTCNASSSLPPANVRWSRSMGVGETLTFTPTARDDGAVYTCEATNPMTGHTEFGTYTIAVDYAPTTPPVIHGYAQGQVLRAGDPLVLTCDVTGGKPMVSSVSFTCAGRADSHDSDIPNGLRSHVTFPRLTLADNGIPCICTARWKDTDVYTLQAFVTLMVAS